MNDDERWRRERRAIVRRHHPDRGGDGDDLDRLLRAHEARRPGAPRPRPAPPGPVGRTVALAGRAGRLVRAHLPRGWPGRRRYIDL